MKRTRIKICGIRTLDAARAAADAGADAVGFVFHAPSPRAITPEAAWEIVNGLPPFLSTVALFVDPSLDRFCDSEEQCPTTLSQLHGNEPDDVVQECGPNIIKAIRFDPATISDALEHWDAFDEVAAILIDGSAGGEGTALDWNALAPHLASRPPEAKPIILAGGLTPANVAEAIRTVRPWGVDVSSGVESTRGTKDPTLIHAFCDAVRRADAG